MYLAYWRLDGQLHYSIRKSVYDSANDRYESIPLFDLGVDPLVYIHTELENCVYFDQNLEETVAENCLDEPSLVLEDLLWFFLPQSHRKRSEMFRRSPSVKLSSLDDAEKIEIKRNLHIFDRRRLFYIRYGAVDQSRIYRVNEKLYRPLLFKCRDEKEYYIKQQEHSLPFREFKKYVYAVFDLQRFFNESYSAYMPEALKADRVETKFLETLCELNQDHSFWQDDKHEQWLRYHLQSYVCRFFDYDYSERSFEYDFYRAFREKHRTFKWPERNTLTEETADLLFGEKLSTLNSMGEKELARLFRKKAKEYHPDSGGDPEKFIQLLDGYESLKKRFV